MLLFVDALNRPSVSCFDDECCKKFAGSNRRLGRHQHSRTVEQPVLNASNRLLELGRRSNQLGYRISNRLGFPRPDKNSDSQASAD